MKPNIFFSKKGGRIYVLMKKSTIPEQFLQNFIYWTVYIPPFFQKETKSCEVLHKYFP